MQFCSTKKTKKYSPWVAHWGKVCIYDCLEVIVMRSGWFLRYAAVVCCSVERVPVWERRLWSHLYWHWQLIRVQLSRWLPAAGQPANLHAHWSVTVTWHCCMYADWSVLGTAIHSHWATNVCLPSCDLTINNCQTPQWVQCEVDLVA